MTNDEITKEAFYDDLDKLISKGPAADKLILLGDMNARVGNDHMAWPKKLGNMG